MNIHVLHAQGLSIRAIGRQLKLSRNTVKRYLRQPDKKSRYKTRPPRQARLDSFKPYIQERIDAAKRKRSSKAVLPTWQAND